MTTITKTLTADLARLNGFGSGPKPVAPTVAIIEPKPEPIQATASEPAGPLFFVVPHVEEGCIAFKVGPSGKTGQIEAEKTRRAGLLCVSEYLRAVRDSFFTDGEGAGLAERRDRIQLIESDKADTERAIAELRKQWQSAVMMDGTDDVRRLEKTLDEKDKQLTRLTTRLVPLKADYTQFRSTLAPKLRAVLVAARNEYLESAERELEASLEPIRQFMNALFLDWLLARSKRDGAASTTFANTITGGTASMESIPE